MSLEITPIIIEVAEQTYSGTIVWTGTTAPSSTTTHRYTWKQIGKLVVLKLSLFYATAGVANSEVTMTLPTDCPAPIEPTGVGAENNFMLTGFGSFSGTATNSNPAQQQRTYLKVNATDTGYLIGIVLTSTTIAGKTAHAQIYYWTP